MHSGRLESLLDRGLGAALTGLRLLLLGALMALPFVHAPAAHSLGQALASRSYWWRGPLERAIADCRQALPPDLLLFHLDARRSLERRCPGPR